MMKGKICLVTGASSGIGKETALGLADKGAHVVLLCRDRGRGEHAIQVIKRRSTLESPTLDLMIADLASHRSVREFAQKFKERYDCLDVLVNNAGLVMGKRTLTEDGIEWTFAVNHLAPFLLTHLLIETMKTSGHSRIVTVSSAAHHFGKIDFEDLQCEKGFYGFREYCSSKLANVLFTYELSRRLKGTGITANCLHPGLVRTNFGKSGSFSVRILVNLGKPFMINAKKGAATSIYLASSADVEGSSGKYFRNSRIARSSRISQDENIARELWERSTELTKISSHEEIISE